MSTAEDKDEMLKRRLLEDVAFSPTSSRKDRPLRILAHYDTPDDVEPDTFRPSLSQGAIGQLEWFQSPSPTPRRLWKKASLNPKPRLNNIVFTESCIAMLIFKA